VLIDAGALALSKDRSGDEFQDHLGYDLGYGLVCHAEGGQPLAGLRVAELHQEHGLIASNGDGDNDQRALFDTLPIGSHVRILPHHACMTAAPYDRYHLVRGVGSSVHAVWGKARGWHVNQGMNQGLNESANQGITEGFTACV
jgi:D-serine deaminase-like pyridoxal phosphate-dependent protein